MLGNDQCFAGFWLFWRKIGLRKSVLGIDRGCEFGEFTDVYSCVEYSAHPGWKPCGEVSD